MHIGTGIYEGKEIKEPVGKVLSPQALTIKEEIFTIIGTRILDAEVLDLSDANGMYGIESLTRGAKMVSFFNEDETEAALVSENLRTLGVDPEKMVQQAKPEEALKADSKFDIIFFQVQEAAEFKIIPDILEKQKDTGASVIIYPNKNGFELPEHPDHSKVVERREFDDQKVDVLLKVNV